LRQLLQSRGIKNTFAGQNDIRISGTLYDLAGKSAIKNRAFPQNFQGCPRIIAWIDGIAIQDYNTGVFAHGMILNYGKFS